MTSGDGDTPERNPLFLESPDAEDREATASGALPDRESVPSIADGPINVHTVRVRTHQTDLNASMYHGAYFDVFDDARIETFRRMGYTYDRMISGGWTAVIRRIECEFYAPARMDDLLTITVHIPRLTAATMTIRYECRRDRDRVALAHAVFAFVEASGKPLRVPRDLRAVIDEHAELGEHSTERSR